MNILPSAKSVANCKATIARMLIIMLMGIGLLIQPTVSDGAKASGSMLFACRPKTSLALGNVLYQTPIAYVSNGSIFVRYYLALPHEFVGTPCADDPDTVGFRFGTNALGGNCFITNRIGGFPAHADMPVIVSDLSQNFTIAFTVKYEENWYGAFVGARKRKGSATFPIGTLLSAPPDTEVPATVVVDDDAGS